MRFKVFITGCLIFIALTGWNQNLIEIPNVITPDGDGINDVFRIKANGYETLTCTIYNRNGEVVYKYFGINGTWDGFTHGGVKVSAGVYFVNVEFTDSSGTLFTQHTALHVNY